MYSFYQGFFMIQNTTVVGGWVDVCMGKKLEIKRKRKRKGEKTQKAGLESASFWVIKPKHCFVCRYMLQHMSDEEKLKSSYALTQHVLQGILDKKVRHY